MGRSPHPWYNNAKQGWYVEHQGRQRALVRKCPENAQTKAEAYRRFGELLTQAEAEAAPVGLSVAALCDHFRDRHERENAPETQKWYFRHLKSFLAHVGPQTSAAAILPLHVTAWVHAHDWNETTRHGAITAVKAAYGWAKREGYLAVDPVAGMKKPTPRRREAVLTEAQYRALLAAVPDQAFTDLLVALRETGARPGEVAGLTADRVDLGRGTWMVVNKTRWATREQTRTIHLTPATRIMSRRLLMQHPEGTVFRNRLGNRWTRNAMACRFADLKLKLAERGVALGEEEVAYSLRHLYITDALERGVPPATVAELVGHRDLTMIMRIYNLLKHRTDHLREAARLVRADPGQLNQSDRIGLPSSRPDAPRTGVGSGLRREGAAGEADAGSRTGTSQDFR